MTRILLTAAILAYLALSRCGLLELMYPEGATILLPFSYAEAGQGTFGPKTISFYIDTPFLGPAPSLSSERKEYPGFAVYEPIRDASGLWQLVRMVGISSAINTGVEQLNIPPDLYNPPKRVGIGAYFVRATNEVRFNPGLQNPDSVTLKTLATYRCTDLAVKVFVSKTGHTFADGVVPLASTPYGKPCVSREEDARVGL